jgi:hypothetical protein
MDRLTELFANKPTSYLGTGIIYNGDTRGNGVSSTEQEVTVLPRFNQSDSAAGDDHPFRCPNSTDGSTASSVTAGTVNGISATSLTPVISNAGTRHVYLNVSYSRALSGNGYVTGFSGGITCAIGTGGSVPTDTTSNLYRLIATYVDGVKTTQPVTTSMEVVIRDNGSGSGTPTAIWGTA